MYLPPIPGTPQPDEQIISMRPTATTTFRLRYGTSPNKLVTYADGGAGGQSINADTRGGFTLPGLSAATRYYWLVECSENSKWKRGWRGHFTTTPSSGGTLKVVYGTDAHYFGDVSNSGAEGGSTMAGRTIKGIHLISSIHDAHAYIDGGDTFQIHYRKAGGYSQSDDFGRSFGDYSITHSAQTQAQEDAFAEARHSFVLRRFHVFLRFMPSIWSRGNHDAGGSFGGNWTYNNAHHWQLRSRPWVVTDIDVDLETDHSNGLFTEVGHGMDDGDGPYRWTGNNPPDAITEPTMSSCGGSRAATDDGNEWYVRKISDDTFRLAYTAIAAGCTGSAGGSGTATLLRGSDMQSASKAVIAEYLPLQNSVFPHGWGGATAEDHVMGPILLSDYVLLINLDEYDFSGLGACVNEPVRFPVDGRASGADCGWSFGTDQLAGILADIAEIQNGGGAYENVEILLLLTHSGVGGHDNIGYSYGRGGLCEVDTTCVIGGADCIVDADCGAGVCSTQDCSDDYAHPEMQSIHAAAAAMVTRASGVALWLMGHDHETTFGEKGSAGVYTYHGSQIGGSFMSGWGTSPDHEKRYDYDDDGIPAYRRHYGPLGYGSSYEPAGSQNPNDEVGSEHRGFSIITMEPAAESSSGNTELAIDFIVNGYVDNPELHGSTAGGFPILIEGP